MTKQTISVLLRKDPIDWSKVKQRAKRHPNETSKRFIHKLCLEPSVPPLFLDWVLWRAPQAQLLRKSGLHFPGEEHKSSSTPLELCLRDNGSRVPYSTFVRIVQATHNVDPKYCPFESLDFLEIGLDKLRALLETYGAKQFDFDALEEFLFGPLFRKTWNWGVFLDIGYDHENKTRLELVLQAFSRFLGCERTSNGVFCLAHTFLVTAYAINRDMDELVLPSALYHFLKRIVGIIKPHEFCVVDDQKGNTILHYIMKYTAQEKIMIHEGRNGVITIDEGDTHFTDDFVQEGLETNLCWNALVNMLLREQQERQPASAWSSLPTMMVNKKGQTPLHIALLHGMPYIAALVDSCAGDDDIMYNGLFPFQLAATASSTDDDRGCDCDCECCEADAKAREATVLLSIYSLLRMKPHLLSSSMVENEDSTALLDCPEYKELVMKELQVARMSREIKKIRKRRSEGLDFEQPRRRVMANTATKAP